MEYELGHFQELKLTSCFRGDEFGVSSVVFDPQEDLLWAATYGGHVTSFYGPNLEKYTAFQAHQGDIRQLHLTPNGVLSVTPGELRYTTRTGLPIYTMKDEPSLVEMHCLLYLDETLLLVGCNTNKITTVDLTQPQVTAETATGAGICLLKASEQYVCSGDVNGQVYVHDPHSLEVVSTVAAHSSGMCDMDVVGHYLVSCGLTRQYGQLCVDCQLKVFDLRVLRPLPPVEVPLLQPLLLRCVPLQPSLVLVASQLGEFQFLDLRGLVTPYTMFLHQLSAPVEGTITCTVDISTSCQGIAFGDSCGILHLWSDREDPVLNPYAQPSIFPSEVESVPHISWDDQEPDSAPLSAIPMPLTSNGPLLSNWPHANSKFTRRRKPMIDPEILSNVKMKQFVGHAPKPLHILSNQVPYDLERDEGEGVPESPMMRETNPLSLVPKPYRQVEIKYTKLGIEMFDFGHYNDSKFAGLEIHIPNAYCNSMLQVLYFLEPMRCAMQSHLCDKEFCLSCELSFLFRMLDHSDGRSCQASNFLRAFRTLREASALGLLLNWEGEEQRANLGKLIQNWNRFVLQQLNQETQPVLAGAESDEKREEASTVERLFGSEVETVSVCRCGWSSTRQSTELLFSLLYPHSTSSGPSGAPETGDSEDVVSFGSILEHSICRQQRLHGWCEQCSKYKSTNQSKSLRALPYVLSLNCQVESEKDREFWRHQQADGSPWLPLSMELTLDEGNKLRVEELPPEENSDYTTPSSQPKSSAVYDLTMLVGHVKEPWMETPGNLVAHICIGPSYHTRKEGVPKTQWYLFNDFAITPIKLSEAAVFPLDWLTPCILIYAQRGYTHFFNTTIKCQLDPTVLLVETHRPRLIQSPVTFTPLALHELPSHGDLVGIDAEFVTLNQEEAEVKSDGTHTTLKPSQLSVARITVVRGKGPLEGAPFIDDYIATSEQVVDYLTKFSGIKPGDLDAMISSKHLTTLKASYLKLLYLLEKGVKFVGHGLKKDFRVINILVPSEQVVDTVELFHCPKQRFVSLKFLAWFYAGLRIQEGAHDSAEDARTALLLYQKYRELEARNAVAESLQQLYETGRSCSWQIPDS